MPQSGKRSPLQGAPVLGRLPVDLLRTGPSGPVATPAPGRSRGDARLPVLSRGLLASPPPSSPRGLAGQSSSRGARHTPAWPDSASPASADVGGNARIEASTKHFHWSPCLK